MSGPQPETRGEATPPDRGFTPEMRAGILERVHEATDGRRWPRRRRRLPIVFALGVLGAGLVTATAWSVLAPMNEQLRHVVCYEGVSTSSYATTGDLGGDPASADRHQLLEGCAAAWRAGVLGHRTETGAPHSPDVAYPVPPLTMCSRNDGTIVVFPARETPELCSSLGFGRFDG